jgi:hypothetical protein
LPKDFAPILKSTDAPKGHCTERIKMTKNREELKNLLNMRRFSTTIGLAGIAAVHVLDLPGKWAETQYLAWGYILVIVAAAILCERLFRNTKPTNFLATAGLALAVFAGFVVNRSVGMPGAMDDIGNWFEPLGLLSLAVEAFTAYQAIEGWRVSRRVLA